MPRECDWGRACDCSECVPDLKPICEICNKGKGYQVGSRYYVDRKGCPDYSFRTCCYDCYEEHYGWKERAYFEAMKLAVNESIRNPPKQQVKPKTAEEGELETLHEEEET